MALPDALPLPAAGLVALHADGRYVHDRLLDQALPLVLASAVAGVGAILVLPAIGLLHTLSQKELPGEGEKHG